MVSGMQQDPRLEDLPIVSRYFTNRRDALKKLAFETLLPVTGLRSNIRARCAACLLSPDQRWRAGRCAFWQGGEPTGWRPWPQRGTDQRGGRQAYQSLRVSGSRASP